MSLFHIIIDGYNFLHASRDTDHDWTHLSLEEARKAIIDFLAVHRRPTREKITVVFDGSGLSTRQERPPQAIEVLFSEAGVTADEVICQIVSHAPNPRAALVVSADREIARHVIACGAKVISPRTFIISSESHHEKRRKKGPPEPPEKFRGVSKGEVAQWREVFGFDEDEQ
jgi:predicted RNA-binding protein with PIN domain